MVATASDRVKETTTTTGTGTYTLAGAATGFQTFVAGVGDANTCYYCVTDDTDWEVGLGTVTDAGSDTLSRDTVLESSNADAAVNWGAGTKTAFVTLPAEKAYFAGGTAVAVADGGTGVIDAVAGKQTIWVPAGAMEARVTTAGATSHAIEQGTNLFPLRTMDFETTPDQFAGFAIQMPASWDASTVIFQAVWSAASGTGTVIWRLKGGAYDDSLALATALGTGVTITDTVLTATDVHISPESTAVTIANTPSAEDWVMFEISRDVTDTLGVDARLHGVKIHYTTNAGTDN